MAEITRQQWLAIGRFRWWWYNTTAKFLLEVIQDLRNEIAGLNGRDAYLSELLRETIDSLKQDKQTIIKLEGAISTLKSQDPYTRMLDTNRNHASKQRIRDLEADVAYLQRRLREALHDKKP